MDEVDETKLSEVEGLIKLLDAPLVPLKIFDDSEVGPSLDSEDSTAKKYIRLI